MVVLDISMPNNCAQCNLNYDCVWCIVTETRFNNIDPYEERLPDCPIKREIKEK